MRARCLITLSLAMAVPLPAVAAEPGAAYSLEQLREIARSVHPTLEVAEAAVEASSGILRQAGAYPNPQFFVAFGRARPRDGGESGSENQIELVQPIEMPGVRRWRSRLAEARLRGVEVDRVLAGTLVDSTVALLVYTVLLEERRADLARESVRIAARLHELLTRRVEIGESSPLEGARAHTELFARRRDLLEAEGATEAARSALRLFCADRLAGAYMIAERLQDTVAIDLPADLIERLRSRNPLLLRAGIAVEEAEAQTGVARQERFPTIDLFAGHEVELDREGTNLGVGLTIPLWDRKRGAISAATAEQSAASAEVRALSLELDTSLERASVGYRRALAEVRLHQEGWTSNARHSLEIVTFSFENGEASLLEVLDAQRSYLSVGLAEAESWASLALARAEIERLIAGPLVAEEIDEQR
jgi:cobalt-zinc-cadmium efflux system outer membrane protein